jgi:EAL domain-containing protein (putative c-di-GMP-specific phosphodiesterase class I)
LGARISIDDFGTGYSSLAYLAHLPLDELKIDSSFVKGMRESEQNSLIVAATIELGHRLGLSVAAEGVEDAETERMLAQMACDRVQGYYVCRPLPAENFALWLDGPGKDPPPY